MFDSNNCLKDALFEMTQSYNYYSHLALKKNKDKLPNKCC